MQAQKRLDIKLGQAFQLPPEIMPTRTRASARPPPNPHTSPCPYRCVERCRFPFSFGEPVPSRSDTPTGKQGGGTGDYGQNW